LEKVRVGIVGCGSNGGGHLSAYSKLPHVELVAACDLNLERAKKRQKEFGIARIYTDFNEMFAKEKLDAISVSTWNNAHAPVAIAALNAGNNVLCEKPMAFNATDAEKMVQAAKKADKLLMIGFVLRFSEKIEYAKQLVEQGKLGKIYYAKVGYLRRSGNPGGWFSDYKRSGGGPLIDLGVHIIDAARYLMGSPKTLSVTGATYDLLGNRANIRGISKYSSMDKSLHNDVEDLATAFIRLEGGASLTVEASWTQHIKKDVTYIELYGERAGLTVEPDMVIYGEENDYLVDTKPVLDPSRFGFQYIFDQEIAHFIDCVQTGNPCRNPAEDGLELMRILDATYKSAKEGKEIIIP